MSLCLKIKNVGIISAKRKTKQTTNEKMKDNPSMLGADLSKYIVQSQLSEIIYLSHHLLDVVKILNKLPTNCPTNPIIIAKDVLAKMVLIANTNVAKIIKLGNLPIIFNPK